MKSPFSTRCVLFCALLLGSGSGRAELRVPAATAYLDPDVNGAKVSQSGITGWTNPRNTISWFGEFKTPGKLSAALLLRLPKGAGTTLRLTVGEQSREIRATGSGEPLRVAFREFTVEQAGYVRLQLSSLNPAGQLAGDLDALLLDGPALTDAHFNLDPRRNAASVHISYAPPRDAPATLFYNEVIGVEDPVATFYMACGFSRGYFGMQVNSTTERRIIFSVWDSGHEGVDRSQVADENRVKLLAKGEGVVAGDFGNEGTGGHSHLVYPWKTGSLQRFAVTARADGDRTDYTGYWFHPEQMKWVLIASFRAPHDGKGLRGLYSFSENFGGSNGHLLRKALFGPAWLRTADDQWHEITEASFSHDPTGTSNRLDRCMGVENDHFFLSHGGFLPGFTKFGAKFTRPPTTAPPKMALPSLPETADP